MTIEEFFKDVPAAAVALSGGVDSAWLLHEAARLCPRTVAYCVRSPFQHLGELPDAQRIAKKLGATLKILDADPLSDPRITANPANRCYYCKKVILATILDAAKADGISLVVEGSNASDDAGDRPGMVALRELGIRSPLRECGITKAQIRAMAHGAELPVWNKPSMACLATRIPTNTPITAEDLQRVSRGEEALHQMGFGDLRLRLRGERALLQVTPQDHARAQECLAAIQALLQSDFTAIDLDPAPRESREV